MLPCKVAENLTVVDLYLYREAKTRANLTYQRYLQALTSSNTILQKLGRGEPDLLNELHKLDVELRERERGHADTDGTLLPSYEVGAGDMADRMLARKIAKPLLQKLHPDRNPAGLGEYLQIVNAAKLGDITLLQLLAENLTVGVYKQKIDVYNRANAVYKARLIKVQSTQQHQIAATYIRGKHVEAAEQYREYLLVLILQRKLQLLEGK